jgi:hypothetical protein
VSTDFDTTAGIIKKYEVFELLRRAMGHPASGFLVTVQSVNIPFQHLSQ